MGFQRSKTISTFWVILRGYQQGQWLSSLRLIWNWPAVFDYCYGVSPGQQNTKARLYYTPLHKRRSSRAVINVQCHHSKSRCGIFFYYLRTLVKFMVNFSLELIDHQMYSITLSQDISDRIVRKLNGMRCPRPIFGLKYRSRSADKACALISQLNTIRNWVPKKRIMGWLDDLGHRVWKSLASLIFGLQFYKQNSGFQLWMFVLEIICKTVWKHYMKGNLHAHSIDMWSFFS